MTSQNHSLFALTLPLTRGVRANTFVDLSGGPAAAGGYAYGVSQVAGRPGEAIAVDVLGTAQVVAGEALTVGISVQVGADGTAVPATTGKVVGRAVQAAEESGDLVEILLIPN